jgi:hypothetical protein
VRSSPATMIEFARVALSPPRLPCRGPPPLAGTPRRYGANINVKSKPTVYGERIADLLPGLSTIRNAMTVDTYAVYDASFLLKSKEEAPLKRALMRAEAELLLEPADSVGWGRFQSRTQGQRAADALVRLAEALTDRAIEHARSREGRVPQRNRPPMVS